MFLLLLLLGVSTAILLLLQDMKKPVGYPPGPRWWPVVGNYWLLRKAHSHLHYHHLVWAELAQQYGPVCGLRLGCDRIVLVAGYDAVREVLTSPNFDGRPDGFFFRLRTFGQRLGVVFTDGQLWQQQRRFVVRHLRDLGMGRSRMEVHICSQAEMLISSLRQRCSKPVAMHDVFDVCVLNSLWTMLAGESFPLNDSRLAEMLALVHEAFRSIDMSGGLLNQMPFLRFIAPQSSGYSRLLTVLQHMWAFLQETIAEHRRTLEPGRNDDLVYSFLQEMEASDKESSFTDMQLVALCLDLFMAGSETTSNSLAFSVLLTLLHPPVQHKLQLELDQVVGRQRQPTLSDRSRLTYTEAVLMEVQRFGSIAPVAVAHRATTTTTLLGHIIPQDTTVLVSLWSVHMDTDRWGDPHKFRPERFLDCDGKLVLDDWLLPFGLGKRRCMGETLARASLFVFFTTLLHNFTLVLPPGEPPPSIDGYDGVTLAPKPFQALLTPRT